MKGDFVTNSWYAFHPMAENIIANVRCSEVAQHTGNPTVVFHPVGDKGPFTSGNISLQIRDKKEAERFKIGAEYTITIAPA